MFAKTWRRSQGGIKMFANKNQLMIHLVLALVAIAFGVLLNGIRYLPFSLGFYLLGWFIGYGIGKLFKRYKKVKYE